ncbi:MAG: M28 family peptidase, partial [Planctomycetes bacterium]|nr:M28 family peptidase [Planctomycetota bacterium]
MSIEMRERFDEMNSAPAQHGLSIPIRATVCLLGIAATLGAFEPPGAVWDEGWFDGDGTAMRLELAMGGEVRGRLLSFTDQVVVIEQDGFPHAVAYQQMETGCAYRTRKAMLSLRRGGPERLWAVDRYALGMLALDRERYDLAVREFAEAGRLDESYQSSGREALQRFRAKSQAKGANKRRGFKSEPTSPFAADSERNTDTLPLHYVGNNTGVDPNDPAARAKIIEGYKRVGNQIRERLGGELNLVETAHFLIWTDWPSAEHDLLGALAEQGCRPRRTIKIAHWDAEEYGIIGSVEWVEEFRDELAEKAVAYINADGAVTGGNVSVSSSPSLKRAIVEATRSVAYPDGRSVYLAWNREGLDEPAMGDLGGGSDHVGFYTHAGIPSAGISMTGSSGVYHSNYDSFAFFERFSDPEFVYGATLARVDGILALRLANADILPYDLTRYPTDLLRHSDDLKKRAEDLGMNISLDRLEAATRELADVAGELEASLFSTDSRAYDPAADRRTTNRMLIDLEKAFLRSEGLQGRAWSRSLFASPDPFSGYASWMLPGLRYEVESRSEAGVREWEATYVAAVQELTRRMRAVTNQVTARRADGAGLVGPDGQVAWDGYHTWQDVHAIMERWSEMYPELTELYSIGQSYEGVDLMVMEVTNEATGPAADKPAVYLDGGIHAAELTGAGTAILDKGLQSMTRRLSDAAQGTGPAVKTLDELGLSAQALARQTPQEQI